MREKDPCLDALTPDEARRWTQVGTLAALAIILGYLETFVPIPIPGVKLGLANIAILVALSQHDVGGAFGIALIKVLASGLLFGSPITAAYSAAGTLLAFALMAPLSALPTMHLAMVSVVGAMAHEVGQLAVASVLLGTTLVWYGAPALLLAGCATGALCGVVAARTVVMLDDAVADAAEVATPAAIPTRGPRPGVPHVDARAVLVGFLAFCVLALGTTSLCVLLPALACAFGACAVGRVRARDVAFALRPLAFMLVITLVAQVASTQAGTPLVTLGPLTVTKEALGNTITMMVRLLALTSASLSVMHLTSTDALVDAIDWLLGPLALLGVRTAGFLLALRTALEFVPVLAAVARQRTERLHGVAGIRELWTDVFPSVVAQLYRLT